LTLQSRIDEIARAHLDKTFTAGAFAVVHQDESPIIVNSGVGAEDIPIGTKSLFDLASVSKLIATLMFLRYCETSDAGVTLDTKLKDLTARLPQWVLGLKFGQGVQDRSFRELLSHSSGLPAISTLFKDIPVSEAGSPKVRERYLMEFLKTPLQYQAGKGVLYSDLGMILVGFALEDLSGKSLRSHLSDFVKATGLSSFTYGPVPKSIAVATEECPLRGERCLGVVHDENCYWLGGASAHAGVFGNLGDVYRLAELMRTRAPSLLSEKGFSEMLKVQAQAAPVRRGLGVVFASPEQDSTTKAFSPGTFGHYGFTGTGLWVDPMREVSVVSLTNRVYFGRDASGITKFRSQFHTLISESFKPGT
jgi:CubicO group peptidase (beta-lactamase class C family)